ncbi:MAG: DUF2842 domain-containing protein [Parvibaculum sp.]
MSKPKKHVEPGPEQSPQSTTKSPMLSIGIRKLLGTLILLGGLTAYTLGIVWIGITILPEHWALQGIFFATAGIAWAFPARPLITWMQRPDVQ